MQIKWNLEFQVPVTVPPRVRDDSKWLSGKLVEVHGLTFVNGELQHIICKATSTPSSSSPVVYRADESVHYGGEVIPDRSELDVTLPCITFRAKAEALVQAATLAGMPLPVSAVRAMLQGQEEFIKDVDGIYEALNKIESERSVR